jgi:hypothetical protein
MLTGVSEDSPASTLRYLKINYPSPKVGNYLVIAIRHGVNISKDLDLHCFARSGLHTYTIEIVADQRHEFRSHSTLSDSILSEHALVTLNSLEFQV